MSDIINLLPDSVANQIAAGEVIQRPASVIKEMVENSLDAGATNIQVIVKDAGKTLIQIIDNGKGMSETDARMSFERHATSKITKVDDIYSLTTMGFRGEALASIAAIAHVELKTRQENNDLGTRILISASTVELQENCSCTVGSNFAIRDIFYNVPVRRKFLKSEATELKYIITEFQKIALCNPEVSMSLYNDKTEIYSLPPTNLKQRIVNVIGKQITQNLIPLHTPTTIVEISGFIGKPEFAKRGYGEQFFFINGRFMKNQAFQRAVIEGYDKILPEGTIPSFFIFLKAAPESIDVNIHPTKTEVNFENAKAVWQMIHASVKEALGKHNIVPSLDFDSDVFVEIPYLNADAKQNAHKPQIAVNSNYNPFKPEYKEYPQSKKVDNWESLYSGFENQKTEEKQEQKAIEYDVNETFTNLFQHKNRYIFSSVKSGLMVIDQKRAYERFLYENIMQSFENQSGVSQRSFFPDQIELTELEAVVLDEITEELHFIGFEIQCIGNKTYLINGTPAFLENCNSQEIIKNIIENSQNYKTNHKQDLYSNIAKTLAKQSANFFNKKMNSKELEVFVSNLFASSEPSYTPDGKAIISILSDENLDKKLNL